MKNYKTTEDLRIKARFRAEVRRRALGVPIKKEFDERFDAKCEPIPVTGCIIWLGYVGHSGYGKFFFNGKLERAHRVAWIKAYGVIPDGMSVLHRCDIPSCVNPNHLFLGTQKDNMRDMCKKNRGLTGEDAPQAKLSNNDVIKIIKDHRGVTFVARDYGVAPSTISSIRSGKSWKKLSQSL